MQRQTMKKENIIFILGILILVSLEFFLHRKVPFIMDDLWYSTNLATNEPLASLSDVFQSQVWHFNNWGGRVVTHGLLQLTLMCGELFCDLLNTVLSLLLAGIICLVARKRSVLSFFLSFALVFSLNANIKMSMAWQSGSANYLYATTWILLFVWVFLRQVNNPSTAPLPFVHIWIPFLGLITGWSNENMGPASFLLAVMAIIYLKKWAKEKIPVWMYTGTAFCLLGSAFVILSPGNFVRVSNIEETGLLQTIYERILSMLSAGTDFLFPSVILLSLVLLIYTLCFKCKLQPAHLMLLIYAVLSYGAMVLSPHYPDRATFGTMCVCIVLTVSLLSDLLSKKHLSVKHVYVFSFLIWLYAVYGIMLELYPLIH